MNETTNPLLARARIPGSTFTLPSQGIFYTNGELDNSVKNGEVVINPMVTIDEITIKTPDKLFSGAAIEEVLNRCVPQIKKPLELLAKDVDFILICLRKMSYGDTIEVSHEHTCEHAKMHEYPIDLNPFIKNTKRIDGSVIESKYKVVLPNEQVVRLSPPRFNNVLRLYQLAANGEDASITDIQREMVEALVNMIRKVDDVTDKDMISEWLTALPIGYVHAINDKVQELSDWGPNTITKVICKDCGEEMEMEVPLNPVAFFM